MVNVTVVVLNRNLSLNKNPLKIQVADHQKNMCLYASKEVDKVTISQGETLYNEMLVVLDELISLKKKVLTNGDSYLKKYRFCLDWQQACLSASNLV
jgi:dihydrofolate reductase